MKNYSIIAQVGQAVGLPSTEHYHVKITIGGFELDFKPFEQKKTPVKYKRYDMSPQHDIKMPYVDIMDFGKVIVQLMDGSKPISYH